LGNIPEHWGVVPLKYLVTLRSGGTPSKDRLDYWDGDIPWASARDLKVDELSETALSLSQKAIDDGAANLVPSGAVLVVVRGMILARTFPVAVARVPMAINQDLKALIPRESLDASFLAWLLRGGAEESLQRLDEAGHGTKALRMDAWTSIQLPLPPKEEQVEIANYIRSKTADIDALCLRVRKSVELLEERRSALIAAAVTGQIDVSEAA
jgi:type I restriction enzyme S subunit